MKMLKKWIIISGWFAFGAATIILFVAAMQQKKHKQCTAISVEMKDANDNGFIPEKEIMQILKANNAIKGQDMSTINLRKTESDLEINGWIKQAELFFDNNQTLHVKIDEREPVARVFTIEGNSFYIDSSGLRLPLSDEQSARVPVFTSFTSDKKILSAPDSLLLTDIKNIAQFIQQDSFWNAQISQVNITPQRTFEMTPTIGDQVIEFGNADSLQSKFDRLFSFYKQVWAKAGFEKYEKIDVRFDGQIVAKVRDAKKPLMDSVKSMQELNKGLTNLNTLMNDTTYAAPIIPGDTSNNQQIKLKTVSSAQRKKSVTTQSKSLNKPAKAKAVMQKKHPIKT